MTTTQGRELTVSFAIVGVVRQKRQKNWSLERERSFPQSHRRVMSMYVEREGPVPSIILRYIRYGKDSRNVFDRKSGRI